VNGRPAAVTDLGGGVIRVTHPLPWALDHVHCYAVADADGWTIVDTGLGTRSAPDRWRAALSELGSPRVRRIVITHYHPDHVGASAALAEVTGAEEIVQGAADAELARLAWGPLRNERAFERYLLLHGMPAELAEESASDEADLPVGLAVPTGTVGEGDVVELGGEPFRVLVLPGHADGHIALLGERTGRLFGGDVLLDEITPNIGRWEDTLPDPLGRYFQTLDRLAELGPSLVFPGHRRMIEDAAGRAAEIRAHHAARLAEHERALRDGATTTYEVSVRVWGEELGFHERRFALVEAISHLERLELEGRAELIEPGRWASA
jgi:glyoxylase-like metal-dependent hydrolase (beta-lactamase superfamily II)